MRGSTSSNRNADIAPSRAVQEAPGDPGLTVTQTSDESHATWPVAGSVVLARMAEYRRRPLDFLQELLSGLPLMVFHAAPGNTINPWRLASWFLAT
ncbi:hypothetical protein CDD80_7460 [Ophiocordyceps camponoti-rufipedis]|uniref:Uncharacterized protein n=1 Tax=Ophiocordyceps camponoti-rufipedis TaxID=2004952 RepID=A0A2C5YIE1_9HYPO|nr:hypothetical protein CDD80_7460 [Ophiocordyceps camponoti-rufipedis]